MSVEFEPVRLGARRRHVDPVAVGAVMVAIALVVSVIKPWSAASNQEVGAIASLEPATPAASQTAIPTTDAALPRIIATRADDSPMWANVAPVIRRHDAWGVRAIVVADSTDDTLDGPRYVERWFRFPSGGEGTSTAFVDDESVAALGVTFPAAHTPLDVRIWRLGSGDPEWVDTAALDPAPSGGAYLYVRRGLAGQPARTWPAGSYRIDVLVDGSIRRLGVEIPARFSNLPDESRRPNLRDLRPTRGTIDTPSISLIDVPVGLFATADGIAVPLPAAAGAELDEVAAWLDIDPGTRRAPRSFVAEAYLPRANRLGVMLDPRVVVLSANITRLAPEPLATVVPTIDHTPRDGAPSTSVTFRAPDDGSWDPGVYRIAVAWAAFDGHHDASWHVELRPGPVDEVPRMLAAARAWARYAGDDGVILGLQEPLVGGPRSAVIRLVRLRPDDVEYPAAFGVGCGGSVIDGNPAILGFAYPDDGYASTVSARLLRPFIRAGDVVFMTAAFGLRGLILVAPAQHAILAPGTYTFTVGDEEPARRYSLCLGTRTFED